MIISQRAGFLSFFDEILNGGHDKKWDIEFESCSEDTSKDVEEYADEICGGFNAWQAGQMASCPWI